MSSYHTGLPDGAERDPLGHPFTFRGTCARCERMIPDCICSPDCANCSSSMMDIEDGNWFCACGTGPYPASPAAIRAAALRTSDD